MNSSLKDLRKQIVLATAKSGEGHIPSAFSVLDLLWVLYSQVMNVDPAQPRSDWRDRFVLSKGHVSLGLYAVLAAHGLFPMDELENFASSSSRLVGHPDCNKVPGAEASTGSLGHGLPMAVGMALGLKIKKKLQKVCSAALHAFCTDPKSLT
jgi:transketolase